jgi:hypothetical protein
VGGCCHFDVINQTILGVVDVALDELEWKIAKGSVRYEQSARQDVVDFDETFRSHGFPPFDQQAKVLGA